MRVVAFWSLVLTLAAAALFASDWRLPVVAAAPTSQAQAGSMSPEPAPLPEAPAIAPGFAISGVSGVRIDATPQPVAAAFSLAETGIASAPPRSSARRAPPARTIPLRI